MHPASSHIGSAGRQPIECGKARHNSGRTVHDGHSSHSQQPESADQPLKLELIFVIVSTAAFLHSLRILLTLLSCTCVSITTNKLLEPHSLISIIRNTQK